MYADTQNDITWQVVHAAQLLLAYGAESDLVEKISQRLGQALELASVELSISSYSLVLTCLVAFIICLSFNNSISIKQE